MGFDKIKEKIVQEAGLEPATILLPQAPEALRDLPIPPIPAQLLIMKF